MIDNYRIEVCTTVEGVQGSRNAWEQMQYHPNTDIDFYLTILESRSEIVRPHVLMHMINGRPKAMMIGRIEDSTLALKIGYKTIYSPKIRLLTIIYGGLLGDFSGDTNDIFSSELLHCLKRGDADALFISHIPNDSKICQLIRKTPEFICRDHAPLENVHWQMDLPVTLNELYAGMTSHRRHELRRYPRVLDKNFPGKIAVRCFQSAKDVDRISRDAEIVAKTTYHRGLGVGFIDNIENRRRLELFAQKGFLRAYLLYVEDRPSAFWIGTYYGKIFYLDFTGYNPKFRKYEIGTILFMKMIEDLCKIGIRRIDFGFGNALYKQRFGDSSWKEVSVYVFAPTFKGVRLNIMRTMISSATKCAGYFLRKTNLVQQIKTYWRRSIIRNKEND